jgi:hypothetical protein
MGSSEKCAAQHRIFGQRFEVPATERVAHAADRTCQQHVCGLGEGCGAENATQFFDAAASTMLLLRGLGLAAEPLLCLRLRVSLWRLLARRLSWGIFFSLVGS